MKAEWFEVNMNGPELHIVENYEHRPYSLNNAVVILDGKVYASNAVTRYLLHSDYFCGAYIQIGRRKMYQVTSKHVERMRKVNDYPRRSERELAVQKRNYEAIAWFEAHITNVREQLVNCIVSASTKNGDAPMTQEDANWLIDNANQFSDEELGEMVGAEAAVVFKKLLAWI